jgi:hypothetical protein
VTTYCAENDVTMEQVAEEIRSKVKEATGGLTCFGRWWVLAKARESVL